MDVGDLIPVFRRGADLLGVAAEHDLRFLVISADTRNHFALDLGLGRDDPAACLDALTEDGGTAD